MSKIVDNINDIETIVSKQDTLVSGTNIKTINGASVLGSGNMLVGATIDYQEFTTSGTWTKPSGCNYVYVEALGGGGSGTLRTGADTTTGGAGGEGIYKVFNASDITSPVTITIGLGGASKTTSGSGNSGGNTSFGIYLTAYGGSGGTDSTSWAGTNRGSSNIFNSAQFYNPIFGFGAARNGNKGGASIYGGGGGAGTSTSQGGVILGGISEFAGKGGNTVFEGKGNDGTYPAGGGGGANGTATQSGAGANGRVRVWCW